MALRFYIGQANEEYIPNTLSTQKAVSIRESMTWKSHQSEPIEIHVHQIDLMTRNQLLEQFDDKYLFTEPQTPKQ